MAGQIKQYIANQVESASNMVFTGLGSMRPVLFVLEIDIVTPSKTFTFAHDLPFADYVQEINEEGLRGGVVLNLDFDITSETELEAEVLQASRMIFGNLIDMMKK